MYFFRGDNSKIVRQTVQRLSRINRDMPKYQKLEVTPCSGALGAEISGVDLSCEPSDDVFDEVHRAFLEYQVIFFRAQNLTPEQHKAFGRRFGPIITHPYLEGVKGHPEIMFVKKDKHERHNFANAWHTDSSYQATPSLGSVLYAIDVPNAGGDTLFSNMYLAYESLSQGMRALLEPLRSRHSFSGSQGLGGFGREQDLDHASGTLKEDSSIHETVSHPVIRTHPETGRKALYVNGMFTICFEGMTEEESAPLLRYLYRHASTPEFTCRFRWQQGSLAMWDNRCTMHYPVNDYHGQFRLMHRVTIGGDQPF